DMLSIKRSRMFVIPLYWGSRRLLGLFSLPLIGLGGGEAKHVVKARDAAHITEHVEHHFHAPLKGCWGIRKARRVSRLSMTVSNGNLSVSTEGLYRLYLQVTFEFIHKAYGKCQRCTDSEPMCDKDLKMFLEISVQRFSNSYKSFRTLLSSQDTMSCSHDWSKTMITTGVFLLDANTKLRVKLQHSELCSTSFFALTLAFTDNFHQLDTEFF
uniref:THD domain-containing protein n=1 Tax=Periophthalmus magnuspinnatus TaxID=409849 RepID=A0A3B4ATC3_9GOBI